MEEDDHVSVYESIALFDDLFIRSGEMLVNHCKRRIAIVLEWRGVWTYLYPIDLIKLHKPLSLSMDTAVRLFTLLPLLGSGQSAQYTEPGVSSSVLQDLRNIRVVTREDSQLRLFRRLIRSI